MKTNKIFTVIWGVAMALLVLTLSVAAPILVRPFYYLHIDALDLVEYTRLSDGDIRDSYDEMMDYCLGLSDEFSAGILPYSQEGASHFADVRTLFVLDLQVLVLSAVVVAVCALLQRRRILRAHTFGGHGVGFWAAVGLIVAVVVIGLLAATDFDRAFTVFHTIFFPGKSNWIFDWRVDAIILILPQVFFRNCAIAIGTLMVVLCGGLIGLDLKKKRQISAE